MRIRISRSLVAATLLLFLGLVSCDEQKERIFNNPFDASGANWSPPTITVLTKDIDVGMGDTTTLRAVVSDPDSQDRVMMMRASVFGFFEDSMAVPTDTVDGKVVSVDTIGGRIAFAEPGRTYRVAVMVHDSRGVWSVRPDTAIVEVHRYPPAAIMTAMSDSVEPGDSLKYAMAWSDTAGKVVRFVWRHNGRVDTTRDSIASFVAGSVGTDLVTGYVVDDDGNLSEQAEASTVVRTLNPWVVSLKANVDTAEANKDVTFTMHGADRAPGKVVRYVWIHDGTKDTTNDSSITLRPASVGKYEIQGLVLDDDGYPSLAETFAIPVTIYAPMVTLLNASSDTVEENKAVKFALKGSDRSPGRIVKWVVSYETKIDSSLKLFGATSKSLVDTSINVVPTMRGPCVVSAYAVDEDGHVSSSIMDTVFVTYYPPTTTLVKASLDTVEKNKKVKVTIRGYDRKPGRIAKWGVYHEGKYDTSSTDSTIEIAAPMLEGSLILAGFVVDDDGYAAAWLLDTIVVTSYAPKAVSMKAQSDTVELNKPAAFRLKGSDRSPGRIVKWFVAYNNKIDSLVLNESTVSLTDTMIAIKPTLSGNCYVAASALDEDGNVSALIYDTVFVTTFVPKVDSLRASSDTTEPGKTIQFRLYGSDRSPGKIAKYVFFHDGEYDTAAVGDTMSLKPDQTGNYVVGGVVIDNDGNASVMIRDTIKVVRYAPKVDSIRAASDTGEVGKAINFTLRGSDRSPGKIAKWVFSYGGKNDTVKADLAKIAATSASIAVTPMVGGTFVIGGYAIDDDGNVSNAVYDTILVASYIPAITSLKAVDTTEVNRLLKITVKAIDHSPGKIVKWVFTYGGSAPDTVSKIADSVTKEWTPQTTGSIAIAALAIDDDGNASPAKAIQVVVARYAPTAAIKGPDSVEINQNVKFTITGADRAPGTIKKYAWSYAGVIDTTDDSTKSFGAPAAAGTMTVAGWVIDNDSNMSARVEVSIKVNAHAPVLQAFSTTPVLFAIGDTAKFVWMASDAPSDSDGNELDFVWSTSDGRSGRCHAGDTVKIRDSVAKQIQVDVKAYDKDSLSSATQTLYIHFISKSVAITSPGSHELLATDTVDLVWTAGLFNDSFIVLLDTLPIASSSQNVLIRDTVQSTSLSVRVPIWDKTWYVRLLSREGEDSALSDEGSFVTPEDADKRTTLAGLVIAADYDLNTPYTMDSAFRADDTLYNVQLPEGTTSVYVQGSGTLPQEVIEIGGQQGAGSAKVNVGVVTVPMAIPVKVYAGGGGLFRTYWINVTRVTQSYVKLEGLSLGAGYSLSPAFHPDTTTYTASIPAGETAPINSTANSLAAVVIKHNNGANYWDNEAVVRGSAEDTAGVLLTVSRTGASDNYYRIKVKILPSRETRLSQLLWADAEWFSIDSASFLRNLGEGTASTWVRPYLRGGQTMTIDGVAATSEVNHVFTLLPGMNTHTIKVSAADGVTTRTYTLLFYRQPSTDNYLSNLELRQGSISFNREYQSYRVELPYEQDSVGVRATASAGNIGGMRLIRMHANDTDVVALASGEWSSTRILAVKDSTTCRIQILAEDTTAKRVYDVQFVRMLPDTTHQLASLWLSSTKAAYEGWSFNQTDGFSDQLDTVIAASVPYNDSLILVAASWEPSWKLRLVTDSIDTLANSIYDRDTIIAKVNDTTRIPVVVTAQDSTKSRTYMIKIFRSAPSRDSSLAYLTVRSRLAGNIWWGNPPDSFDLSLPYEDSLVTFAPASSDAYARRITVDESITVANTWSDSVVLTNVANVNRIVIKVTAQDTTAIRTYVVRILRQAAHTDASLSSLVATSMAGNLSLSPSFSGSDTVYTASTLYLDSSVTIKPTWNDAVARRILVNGAEVASGTASSSIHLPVGDTNISVLVRAQDTTATRTYTLKISRTPKSTNALLVGFGENAGTLSPMVNSADVSYRLNVVSAVSTVTLAPTVQETHASFLVNGDASMRTIPLGVAGTTTTATVLVTAQDTSVKRTYTLNIVRERDADTIGGQILANTTLELAGSPYVVEAALVVNSGVTLTIKPGVRLKFKTGIGMSVQGTLIAEGTATQPIVFTRAESSKWGILDFDTMAVSASYNADGTYASGSIIKHCVFEYGGNASNVANAANLYLKKGFPHIDSTTIQYSSSQGIYGTGIGEARWNGLQVVGSASNGVNMTVNKFFLRHSTLSGNGRGMVVTPTAAFTFPEEWLVIDTSAFLNNSVSGHAGGLYIGLGDNKSNLKTVLRGNRFEGNVSTDRAGALYYEPNYSCLGNSLLLEGNTFKSNHAGGEGGAMMVRYYLQTELSLRLTENLFEENYATRIGAVSLLNEWASGGSSYYDSANVYRNNRSTGTDGYSGAVWVSNDNLSLRIVGSRFEGNSVPNSTSGTGALDVTRISGTAEVLNNVFKGNSGNGRGAAIFCRATNLVGNLFQSNSSQTLVAAVQWTENAAGTISNNTFYGNSAARVGGKTIATNSIVMQIDGFPAITGNNFLANSTDRVLRTDNVLGETNVDAKDNWWNTDSPTTYKIIVDKYANLDDASSLAAFTVNPVLSALNSSAPATE